MNSFLKINDNFAEKNPNFDFLVSCHTLEAKDGPTAIHWTCQRDGSLPSFVNPYYVNVTEGTACSPTSM